MQVFYNVLCKNKEQPTAIVREKLFESKTDAYDFAQRFKQNNFNSIYIQTIFYADDFAEKNIVTTEEI